MGLCAIAAASPMSAKKGDSFALIGTITHDVITRASGPVFSGLGGILYQAAGLCGLGKDVFLYTHLGRELQFQLGEITAAWPKCHSGGVEVVAGAGNNVFLHYPEQGERIEILESHVPPLKPDVILDALPQFGFLILVINSGFDIALPDWRRIVRRAECPVWFDVHSLALSLELHRPRRYRPLPQWKEWAEGVTYLQANVKEVASMLGRPEETPSPDKLQTFGRSAHRLGIKAVFITLGADGVLVLTPDLLQKLGSPEAGRVVDTTGCGDIFCAGAAAMLASGARPVEAAALAVELASEAAQCSGVVGTYHLIRNHVFKA